MLWNDQNWNILVSEKATIKKQNHSPQFGNGKFLKHFAGQENNFTHRFLREPRRKLDIQFIKARKEPIAMLPLAMKDINENKSRFRTAAVKQASTFYDWHVKCFVKFLLPFKALCCRGSIIVKCQSTKQKAWNMKYYGKLKTCQAAKLTASDVGAVRWTSVCSYG